MKTLVQHPDNDPGDHRPQDPGIDRLNTDDVLDIVGFQHRRIGRGQNSFRGEPEVHRQVHDRIANEAGESRHAFIFARQPQRNRDTEHDRQEAKGKGADFAHPDKHGLQQRNIEPRQQGEHIMTA